MNATDSTAGSLLCREANKRVATVRKRMNSSYLAVNSECIADRFVCQVVDATAVDRGVRVRRAIPHFVIVELVHVL